MEAFAPFEDDKKQYSLLPQKLLYILIQLGAIGIGVYKLGKYGLLPTTVADWLPWYIVIIVRRPHTVIFLEEKKLTM
jgi:hypothetical protein